MVSPQNQKKNGSNHVSDNISNVQNSSSSMSNRIFILLLLFCCFTSTVNIQGHVGTAEDLYVKRQYTVQGGFF